MAPWIAQWLVLGVGVVYCVIAGDLFRIGNWPLGGVHGAYALANVFLYFAMVVER